MENRRWSIEDRRALYPLSSILYPLSSILYPPTSAFPALRNDQRDVVVLLVRRKLTNVIDDRSEQVL